MDLTQLKFTAKAALLAGIGWALYRKCHLIKALEELRLILPMVKALSEEYKENLQAKAYADRETLLNLAKELIDSMIRI